MATILIVFLTEIGGLAPFPLVYVTELQKVKKTPDQLLRETSGI